MTTMAEESLNKYRSRVRRGELLTRDEQLAVINHGLTLLNPDGSPTVQQRQDLAERDNQVKEALAYLRATLEAGKAQAQAKPTAGSIRMVWHFAKALFTVDTIGSFLRSRKTKNFQRWSDWVVLIEEEFSEVVGQL